jgi:hypothetical protein
MRNKTRLAIGSRLLQRRAPSPIGALARGLLAGAVGAFAQEQFFKLTSSIAPKPTQVPESEGGKPRDEQAETALETTARRVFESLMRRGPLSLQQKRQAGQAVHYAFGAAWGGLYALTRESLGAVPPPPLFGAVVWAVGDNVVLPLFRLAGWPVKYSLKEHLYALVAHMPYAGATGLSYELLREVGLSPFAALPALLALRARAFFHKTPPGWVAMKSSPAPVRFFWQVADEAFAH